MHHRSKTPWNKDQYVGPRTKFTPSDVCRLAEHLRQKEVWHDLCLFTVGIDSMLRCSDLLKLRVSDVSDQYGVIVDRFILRQTKTGHGVAPALTKSSREACKRWIEQSGKKVKTDFLFTRSKQIDGSPINDNSYRTLVKQWAATLRLDPTNYSTHSLRRSKPHFMFRAGVKIEYISQLLGHKDTSTTYRYLGITQEEAQAYALKRDIFKKSLHHPKRPILKSVGVKDVDVFATCQTEILQRLNETETSIQNLADILRNLEAENRALIACIKDLITSISKPNPGKD